MHLGYDTRIGKTLSVIISFAVTYPHQKVLILDMDNYGFKVHSLLAPLADRHFNAKRPKDGRDYGLYRIGGSQTYIASWPNPSSPNSYFENIKEAITNITNSINSDLDNQGEPYDFQGFDHVIVDTSETILRFIDMDRALVFPHETIKVKFWINHDCVKYPQNTTSDLFWEAHNKITNYNGSMTKISGNASFVYIFNPAGFMTDRGQDNAHRLPILGFFGNIPYTQLVNQKADPNVWTPPNRIITSNNQTIEAFDQELDRIMRNYDQSRGDEVAKWWNRNTNGAKPLNVIFIPVEADLRSYREKWASKPLNSLNDFRLRLGEVLKPEALREQWLSVINKT
jgi:hypothetical protein